MRQNMQSTRTSEDAFADTQWGKDALHCDYSPIQVRDLKAHNTRLHPVGTSLPYIFPHTDEKIQPDRFVKLHQQ